MSGDQFAFLFAAVVLAAVAIARLVMWWRTLPRANWHPLTDEPHPDDPPRCYACNRMYIWPDGEPVPPRHRCLECRSARRARIAGCVLVLLLSAVMIELVYWLAFKTL